MTEYTALVLVILGLMVYLINLAFNLSDNYDPLKLFLITVSMFFGTILLHLGKSIAVDQGASTAIANALDISYYVWIVITGVALAYFVVYLIIRAWNALNTKHEIHLYDEENR